MKKNIAMRVAAFLFVLTMVSICTFATTFAKYTTTGSAEDSARVAKWGVTVTAANEEGLFASAYNDNKVKSEGSPAADVVAPGTSGSLAGFTVSGKPEVAVNVTYAATLTLTGWTVDSAEYCPIVFTVNGTKYLFTTNIADLEDAVEDAIAAASASYDANTTISDTLSVSWAWAYSSSADNDVKDTALGNLATAPTIELVVDCTVTQAQ